MVKLDGAYVVQVTIQSEQTTSCLVIPHFDLVIVTTRDKKRLRRMEGDAAYRAYKLCVRVNHDACSRSTYITRLNYYALPSCSSNRSRSVPMR